MGQKPDYLKDCMSDVPGVPIDDFNRSWCVVCTNSGCSRSSANGLAFTRRAENWKEDLFLNVRRAPEDDPKYASIRAKAFIVPTPSYEVSSQTSSPTPGPKWFTPVTVEEEDLPPDTDPAPEPSAQTSDLQVPAEPPPQAPRAPQPLPVIGSSNTPFSQGTVLTGALPVKTEVVMQPGQTYTFGEDE